MKRSFAVSAALAVAFVLLAISLLAPAAYAAKPASAPEAHSRPASAPSGGKTLDEFLASKSGKIGVYAIRLRDGAVLASHDATVPMTPGSVEKVATSAVALAVLGPDFQFTTTCALLGKDLVVVGDGDPTFGDPLLAEAGKGTIYDEFDEWAQKLKAAGVTSIAGDLVLDDSIISAGRHEDWPENQLQTWYCAPVGGLNFNDNCVDVRASVTGGTVVPSVTPSTRFMPVVNELKVGAKDLWGVKYAPDDSQVIVTGQVRRSSGEGESIAVNNPTLLFGRTLRERLAQAGVTVAGQIVIRRVRDANGNLPAEAKVIARHSTPLGTVITRANKRSLNMMAECELLRCAAKKEGLGTFESAARVGKDTLMHVYGLDENQIHVVDGSGMSRENRISAAALVTLLRKLIYGPSAGTFVSSLPILGVDGTLEKRLKGHDGRVRAKTGTIAGVSALAGYVLDSQNRPAIIFAILTNDLRGGVWQGKQIQDSLMLEWMKQADD